MAKAEKPDKRLYDDGETIIFKSALTGRQRKSKVQGVMYSETKDGERHGFHYLVEDGINPDMSKRTVYVAEEEVIGKA